MKNKGRGKKKKKFQDLNLFDDIYVKKQNNDTFHKNDDDKKESNNNKNDFKSSLDKLIFLFPNFSSDLIEEMYDDNGQNFSKTKDVLRQLSEEELGFKEKEKIINSNQNIENHNNQANLINENNNKIIEKNEINEDLKGNNKNNNEKINNQKYKIQDITHLAKFEIAGDGESLENEEEKKYINKTNIKNSSQDKNDTNKGYNYLLDIKDKNKNEYISIFNEETNFNNNCNNNCPYREEVIVDDYLFDQNIQFLTEMFPNYTREKIIKKLCDFNFDVDNLVLELLKEMNSNTPQSEDDFANLDLTDKDEILSNFLVFENGEQADFDFELFQENLVQKEIEEIIKRDIKKQNNENNEDEKQYISSLKDNIENRDKEPEEFFLNKKVDDIQTPKIKEDIKKLIKHFPLEEEFNIKLVYYQYMNYQMSYKYFSNKDDVKIVGLKSLLDSLNKKKSFSYSRGCEVKKYNKNKKPVNKFENTEKKRQYELFKRIIDKKPVNWKLEEDKNYNLNDFMEVRKRLIIEARNSYSNQKFQNGNILMAKAKRYKQEIDKIYKNNKIQQFAQNNENRNNNEIDLHGLNVQESKYIIDAKIKSLKQKKIENNLKSISLNIITGRGSHSMGHIPVLFSNLIEWLRKKEKISPKGDLDKGIIFVTIF